MITDHSMTTSPFGSYSAGNPDEATIELAGTSTDPEELTQLIADGQPKEVRIAAAGNIHTPREVLEFFEHGPDYHIASRASRTVDEQRRQEAREASREGFIAKMDLDDIAALAKDRHDLPQGTVDAAMTTLAASGRVDSASRFMDSASPRALASVARLGPEYADAAWASWIDGAGEDRAYIDAIARHTSLPKAREWAASNKHTAPKTFAYLARDRSTSVRGAVASNRATPAEVLESLTQDKSTTVAAHARHELKRRHPTA